MHESTGSPPKPDVPPPLPKPKNEVVPSTKSQKNEVVQPQGFVSFELPQDMTAEAFDEDYNDKFRRVHPLGLSPTELRFGDTILLHSRNLNSFVSAETLLREDRVSVWTDVLRAGTCIPPSIKECCFRVDRQFSYDAKHLLEAATASGAVGSAELQEVYEA